MSSKRPKRFFNDARNIVEESIDGLIAGSGGRLSRLDGFSNNIRVVVRSDYESAVKNAGKVAIISGGGSGHEPAHAGFVGEGLLTAAVCGDVFASPSVDAVLQAIRAVTGEAGCLMIVKNYTGDRLNFGLAAEKARLHYQLKVSMVVVGDDVALPDAFNPRGIAGVVLVHKVAGHAAMSGLPLSDVTEAANLAASSIYSLGVSLSTCQLPGAAKSDPRLDGDVYELGLGIHGEPGVQTLALESADAIVTRMVTVLLGAVRSHHDATAGTAARLLLFANNLGAVPEMEMTLLLGQALREVAKQGGQGVAVSMAMSGTLLTSLDMNGFSLTLMALTDALQAALLAPCDPSSAWVVPRPHDPAHPNRLIPLPPSTDKQADGAVPSRLEPDIAAALQAAMEAIVGAEEQLSAWDGAVGDGDCGATFRKGAERVLQHLSSYPSARAGNSPSSLLATLASDIGSSMGGSSGVIISIFLSAAAAAADECVAASRSAGPTEVWMQAFRAGVDKVQAYGGARVGSRTLVDALVPAMQAGSLAEMAELARQGAESTRTMEKAKAGRSAYLLGTNLEGTPDPGAMAIALVLDTLAAKLPGC
eukprot:jgi/Mesvir1/14161/Mv09629-RA.2